MLLSVAEMDLLKIIGVYRECPTTHYQRAEIVALLSHRLVRINKARTSYRLTWEGAKILTSACVQAEVDKNPRSEGRVLERRLQAVEIALFLNLLEANIFLEKVSKEVTNPGFLSTNVIRSLKSSNVLGISKFNGVIYTKSMTYITYNVSNEDELIFPQIDEEVFRREVIRANNPVKILYMKSATLDEMLYSLLNNVCKNGNQFSYYSAIDEFSSPVCLVPLNACGQAQLQIMLTENYGEKVAQYLLKSEYVKTETPWADAIYAATGEYLLVFFDFDIKRLRKAMSVTDKLLVLVLSEQETALDLLLDRKSITKFTISREEVFSVLGIKPPECKNRKPFLTETGDGIIAEEILQKSPPRKGGKFENNQ